MKAGLGREDEATAIGVVERGHCPVCVACCLSHRDAKSECRQVTRWGRINSGLETVPELS